MCAARIELRGREIHRAELAVERVLGAGLLLGAGNEFVGGGPGLLFVLLGRPARQQPGDDQPVEQLRFDLFAPVLRQHLPARVQVGLELQKRLVQVAAFDFNLLAFAKHVVGKKLPGIRRGFGRVFFGGLGRVHTDGGDCQSAHQGHHNSGFHLIFLFWRFSAAKRPAVWHVAKRITTSQPARC